MFISAVADLTMGVLPTVSIAPLVARTTILLALFVTALQCDAGLIAHYGLNGDALDLSGNSKHGAVNGATATFDRFGAPGQAMSFDGENDYIQVTQLLFNGDSATIAFWAKSNGAQNALSVMVSQGHWGADTPYDTGFAFQYGHPGSTDTEFIWGDNIGGTHSWNSLFFPIDIESNLDWHHYAVTADESGLRIYFDGELVGSSSHNVVYGIYDFNIGRDFYNADNNHRSFNGSIDDVFVYDASLTQSEIHKLMSGRIVPEPASAVIWLICSLVVSGTARLSKGALAT